MPRAISLGRSATIIPCGCSRPMAPGRAGKLTWMGDDGFLRRLQVQVRRHNPVGDTLYINGEVTRTFADDGAHYAEIAQRATNQDGELSVLATGIVRLPTRGRK